MDFYKNSQFYSYRIIKELEDIFTYIAAWMAEECTQELAQLLL